MKNNFNEKDKKLWRAIDEVLYYIWDPIGVSWAPQARDEYYSYTPRVFKILKDNNTSTREVAEYLNEVITESMGLPSNFKKCEKVADLLINWRDCISV